MSEKRYKVEVDGEFFATFALVDDAHRYGQAKARRQASFYRIVEYELNNKAPPGREIWNSKSTSTPAS
jgi:hypothetical protein